MTHDTDVLMSPDDIALYLRVPVATIYRWRHRGTGPPGMRVGRHVRYWQSAVDAWLDDQGDPRTMTGGPS